MSLDIFAEPERERSPARDTPWGVIASAGAHVLLLALLPLLALSSTIVPPAPPQSVEVELLNPADFEPPVAAAEAPVLAAPQAAPDAEPAETASLPGGPIEATQFFAGRIVAEDKRIAAALPTLGNDERVIQLCNIEALEQIRAAKPEFAPDTLVAYAFDDMNVAAGVLTAPGGAFRSRRRWWNVSLKCAVAADYSAVTAFEFTLGDEVPREEWDAHDLTDEDAEE